MTEMGRGEREELQRDSRKLLGVMDMFAILTVVNSFTHTYIMQKCYQTAYLKYTEHITHLIYLNKVISKRGKRTQRVWSRYARVQSSSVPDQLCDLRPATESLCLRVSCEDIGGLRKFTVSAKC